MSLSVPVQHLLVYRADGFRVTEGANLGDAISVGDDLVPNDIYVLSPRAMRHRLALHVHGDARIEVAPESELGTSGAALHLDCAVQLMSPEGELVEALVLVEVDADSTIAEIFLLPLSQLDAGLDYQLVDVDRDRAQRKFAQVACVSFSRGTRITLASGAQCPIEDLKVGDRVLTRDHGAQEVRWIGQSTVRATGDFAPIVIKAGTLNNEGDLVVSPDHRLFVYQRSDRIGAGQRELLVKARHLVNGQSVYVMQGGFVDYFQILFDRHHIIYAEGIAAESLLVEPRTRPALPRDLLEKLSDILPHHGGRADHGLEVQKILLDRPDAIELLRRASQK